MGICELSPDMFLDREVESLRSDTAVIFGWLLTRRSETVIEIIARTNSSTALRPDISSLSLDGLVKSSRLANHGEI